MKTYPSDQIKALEAIIEMREIQSAMYKLIPKTAFNPDGWIGRMDEVDKQILDLHIVKMEKALNVLKSKTTPTIREHKPFPRKMEA